MSNHGLIVALAILVVALVPLPVAADFPGVENTNRARVNYMLSCQGCHGPDGSGTVDGEVPEMNSFLGKFLTVEGGREFLIQVPGSANAALTDAQLAEVINWLLPTISAAEMPADFTPYTAEEVQNLRLQPLQDVVNTRAELIQRMGLPPQEH